MEQSGVNEQQIDKHREHWEIPLFCSVLIVANDDMSGFLAGS